MYYPQTKTYAEILPTAESLRVTRVAWIALCPAIVGTKAYITDGQLNTVWALLAAKYGESHINFNSESAFKAKLIATIGETAPKFFKDLAIQQKLATLDIEDSADMALISNANSLIANHADHPATAPNNDSLAALSYIDSQNVSTSKRGTLESLSILSSLLRSDLYTEFTRKFKNLFISIALPECECCSEEDSRTQDIKTIDITHNGEVVITPDLGYDNMNNVVANVQVGESARIQNEKEVTFTRVGTSDITPDTGYDAIAHVTANVDIEGDQREEYITSNGTYTYRASEGYDLLDQVKVNVAVPQGGRVENRKDLEITENGNYVSQPSSGYDGVANTYITVNVPTGGRIQFGKSVTFTSNGTRTVTPDSGYDALAGVSVTTNVTNRLQNPGTITPTTSQQTFNFDTAHYDGYNNFVVGAVGRNIDSNIKATNIKSGVTILGVTGTYEGSGGGPECLEWFEEYDWTPTSSVLGEKTFEFDDHGSLPNYIYIFTDKKTPTVNREFGGVMLTNAPADYTWASSSWYGYMAYRQTTALWQKASPSSSSGITSVTNTTINVKPNDYGGTICSWIAGSTYHVLIGRFANAVED